MRTIFLLIAGIAAVAGIGGYFWVERDVGPSDRDRAAIYAQGIACRGGKCTAPAELTEIAKGFWRVAMVQSAGTCFVIDLERFNTGFRGTQQTHEGVAFVPCNFRP